MSRNSEASDSEAAAPIERASNNISNDSMTSKPDSDLARSAAYNTTNDVSSWLDPKGNEFGIDGLDNNMKFSPDNPQKVAGQTNDSSPGQATNDQIQNTVLLGAERQPAPGQIHPDKTSITVNSEDGLTKSVITGNQQEKLQFSPDGHLRSFSQTDNDGTTTSTTFDDNGKAIARSQKNAYGEYSKLDVPDASVHQTVGPDGKQQVSISENGRQTSFGIDKDGHIVSEVKGSDAHNQWKTFDGKGDVQFEGTRDQDGNIIKTTTTANGHTERRTTDTNTGETNVHRVDQFHKGKIDTRFQKTDDFQIHKDGSTDGVTKYVNEPGKAFKFHTDAPNTTTPPPRQVRRV